MQRMCVVEVPLKLYCTVNVCSKFTASKQVKYLLMVARYNRPHTALAVRPDVLNAKYHVITNATYNCHNRDPVQAKFKHVTNIETCTLGLLCCDHIALWKALDANMVENGACYSDKNVKIQVKYQWIG